MVEELEIKINHIRKNSTILLGKAMNPFKANVSYLCIISFFKKKNKADQNHREILITI